MRILTTLFLLLALAPVPARAQVLVELFTSQGCSSCPPADKILAELAARDDVIALAYHVDYWDYLGWKDTFARPEFSDRQRKYSAHVDRQYIGRRLRGSFTPEIVIGGHDSLIGSARQAVISRIVAHQDKSPKARLSLKRANGKLSVEVTPTAAGLPRARLMVAHVLPEATVAVERGENHGRTLTYHQVVRSLSHVANWDGASPARFTLDAADGMTVVFLQVGEAGPVLAAAQSY